MEAKVEDCRLKCIEDIERQIEGQKIYINSAHPVFKIISVISKSKNCKK